MLVLRSLIRRADGHADTKVTVLIAVLELLVALLRLIDLLSNGQIETHLRGKTASPFNKILLFLLIHHITHFYL